MKMKKVMAMLMASAMCVGMMAGCGPQPADKDAPKDENVTASGKTFEGKITLVMANKDEFRSSLDQASKAAATAQGVNYFTSVDCGEDQDRVNDAVKAAAEGGASAIIVNLADDTRAAEVVEAAGDVPIVFVNRTPQDTSVLDDTHIYVGSDESTSGVMQGELLADALKEEGKDTINYIMLQGTAGLDHTIRRSDGVLQALKDAGITANAAADPVDCGYDRQTAMDTVSTMIANGLDMSTVDVIISNNDAMALGAIEALRQADVDPTTIDIVGIDATNAGLQALVDGTMTATVYQSAVGQGYASVRAAINLANGDDVMDGIDYEKVDNNIIIPFEKVTPDDVSNYY